MSVPRPARAGCPPQKPRPSCEALEDRTLLNGGDPDYSFGGDGRTTVTFPGAEFIVEDVAVRPDGKVILAGTKGDNAAVVRLNADGSTDTSFGQSGLYEFVPVPGNLRLVSALAVALQPDGRIVVVGSSNIDDFTVSRLLPNGTLDTAFNDGYGLKSMDVSIDTSRADVVLQADGKIVFAAGHFDGSILDGDYDFAVCRVLPDGNEDDTFDFDGVTTIGFGGDEEAHALAIDYNGTPQSNPLYGTIVVAGGESGGDISRFNIARLTPDGQPDVGFDNDGKLSQNFRGANFTSATGVVIQPGGRIVATGVVGTGPVHVAGDHDFVMARFLASGDFDTSFGTAGTGWVRTQFGGDDRAFDAVVGHLGGIVMSGLTGTDFAVAAYTRNGLPDARFDGNGTAIYPAGGTFRFGRLARVAVGPGRRLVVAGGVGRVSRFFDVAPVVGVLSFDTTAHEAGRETAAFLVVREEAAPTPLRVYLSVGGTATPPGAVRNPDYSGFTPAGPLTPQGGYVDIPAGQTFATVVITPGDDTVAEGDETAVFALRADDEYDFGPTPSVTITIVDDEPPLPARVTQVFVSGPGLTSGTTANAAAFRALAGIDPVYGYPVPAGANQLKSIPWAGGINQVALRFDRDVAANLQMGDLVVRGINNSVGPYFAFNYNPATRTALWMLSAPITNDKVRLFLDDALLSNLDGEWANGAGAYPSGNGATGGDFNFRVNVLGGDASGDGQVNATDLAFIKQRLNRTATSPGTGAGAYSVFADLNADGTINAIDLSLAKQRLNLRLPAGEPATTGILWGA